MVKSEEKIESKKEYMAPQMEVMVLDVQGFLCDSAPGSLDVEIDD